MLRILQIDVDIVELEHEGGGARLQPAGHSHQGFASVNRRAALPELDDDIRRERLADVRGTRDQAEAVAGAGVELGGEVFEDRANFGLGGRAAPPPPQGGTREQHGGERDLQTARHLISRMMRNPA